ncbi:hypothetical protein L2E82_25887 [Cichorium intybus]|uniref:Uncharacterized protein n=1 Tax=Cichorium intybus TaxID=13427 RepID=A0ACB9E5D0_CICIN|nr:hypothetical protein L2E82_25887 [Cichorium intybus]
MLSFLGKSFFQAFCGTPCVRISGVADLELDYVCLVVVLETKQIQTGNRRYEYELLRMWFNRTCKTSADADGKAGLTAKSRWDERLAVNGHRQ